MIHCPKCDSKKLIKNGFVQLRQRYKCKNCSTQFIPEAKHPHLSFQDIRSILHLYIEGLKQREIAILTNLPHTTINYHINTLFQNSKIKEVRNNNLTRLTSLELLNTIKLKLSSANHDKIIVIDYENGSSWLTE